MSKSCLEIADGHCADLLQLVPLVLVQFLAKVKIYDGWFMFQFTFLE